MRGRRRREWPRQCDAFAGIPYEWYTRNDIAHFEVYYASVFYSHFAGAGLDVAVRRAPAEGGRARLRVRVQDGGRGRRWLGLRHRIGTPQGTGGGLGVARLVTRRLLAWFLLLAGSKTGTRCRAPGLRAVSCMLVKNPSSVRT